MCLSLRKDRQFTGCGTQVKGSSEKERERLPCGIKLISLLSLHQKLAFKLARRLFISGRSWQHHDLLGLISPWKHRGCSWLARPRDTGTGQTLPEVPYESQHLACAKKQNRTKTTTTTTTPHSPLSPENLYLLKFPNNMSWEQKRSTFQVGYYMLPDASLQHVYIFFFVCFWLKILA